MLRKLASNTLVGLVGNIAQKALAFVTTLVLAHGLGQDGFGVYSFVGAYIFFFSFLVDLGMERVVTRELSQGRYRLGHLLGNAILLKLGLCAVVVPAAMVVASLLTVSPEVRLCILLAALGLPLSLDLLFRSYFQSQYEVKLIYLVTLPSSVLFLVLVSLCVHWSLSVRAVFSAALFNAVLTLVLLLSIAVPRTRLDLRPDPALLKMLLRDGAEVGLFVLLFMLAWRIDQILLFQLRGGVEVGRYAVGVRLSEALSLIPETLMLTVFPVLASSHNSAPERFIQTYRLSFKYLSAIILPIALLLTLTRYELVVAVFGEQYRDSALPLAILGWGMFFAYTGAVYLNLFIIEHLQRVMVLVSAVAVAVNIGANLLLIPSYGATGTAIAVVMGNVVGFALFAALPSTGRFMAVCVRETARPLIGVTVAWISVTALSLSGVAAGVVALAVYVGVMLLVRGLNWSDIDLVRRLFAGAPVSSGG